MSGAPARGIVPRRQRRHHHHRHHHQKHKKHAHEVPTPEEPEEKRPKVNPIFLWASQHEQRIVEVRCEDYDKRNRIKLTKTAQGWRSIPRTASNMYSNGQPVSEKKLTSTSVSGTSDVSNDEKENGEDSQSGYASVNIIQSDTQKESSNIKANGLVPRVSVGKKRTFSEINEDRCEEAQVSSNWIVDNESNEIELQQKSRIDRNTKDTTEDDTEDEVNENFEKHVKDLVEIKSRIKLDRLHKHKLFQPRVVLEQLHLSQLSESIHHTHHNRSEAKSNVQNTGKHDEKTSVENEQDQSTVYSSLKNRCGNKEDIDDMLNMINVTPSPILATDTPSPDLPGSTDSTRTLDLLMNEDVHKDDNNGDNKTVISSTVLVNKLRNKSKTGSKGSYQNEKHRKIDRNNSEISSEIQTQDKIVENVTTENCDKNMRIRGDVVVVPVNIKEKQDAKFSNVSKVDRKIDNNKLIKDLSKGQNFIAAEKNSLETEEEISNNLKNTINLNCRNSSEILEALRKTPGLSISITKVNSSDNAKIPVSIITRPTSKASTCSRSPDSQTDCIERLMKNDTTPKNVISQESRQTVNSPRNLPGLSIVIPNYKYRIGNNHQTSVQTPLNQKNRVESPESTVNIPRLENYPNHSKTPDFLHEPDNEIEEDEDEDCDPQVLEDLRKQKMNSISYGGIDKMYYKSNGISNQNVVSLITACRNSEAQAKCKYQDVEHFDEQVLEELRSRGTVVSPQPSGIPCSPASRRPSSAYLERLLPSPPCSVSCSEDAKNDLTLKGILASPNGVEGKDCEKSKEELPIVNNIPTLRTFNFDRYNKIELKKSFRERQDSQNEELTIPCRSMSNGDIHNTYSMVDRNAPKRPLSTDWSMSRQKNQSNGHHKSSRKTKTQSADYQEICAASSTADQLLDPASQLRELIELSGHLIPDPLLVPRHYLPALAAAPASEIPKLLTSRPELRLPEALTRPDLLRDPDLLVISLAHLQHVLDHGEGPVSRSQQAHPKINNGTNKGSSHATNGTRNSSQTKPKLSCKPIGTLMPAPIDLSSNRRVSPYPPLLRVRTGLLKQEAEVTSTANSPDDSQLWHPLFGSHKRQQQQQQHPQQHTSWHRTTLAS